MEYLPVVIQIVTIVFGGLWFIGQLDKRLAVFEQKLKHIATERTNAINKALKPMDERLDKVEKKQVEHEGRIINLERPAG